MTLATTRSSSLRTMPQHFQPEKRQRSIVGRAAVRQCQEDEGNRRKKGTSEDEDVSIDNTATGRSSSGSPTLPVFDETFVKGFEYSLSSPSTSMRHQTATTERASRGNLRPEHKRVRHNEEIKRKGARASGKMTKVTAHEYLPEVPDHVKDGMDVLFIGSNPGRMSSQKGQHFGHPSNHFYRALHGGGFTPEQVSPADDYTMLAQRPPLMSLGLTNLAPRPTRLAEEVLASENEAGAAVLIDLMRKHRPRLGIFVGLGVARAFEQAIKGASLHRVLKEEAMYEANMSASASYEQHTGSPSARVKKEKNADSDFAEVCVAVPDATPLVSDKTLGAGVGLMPIAIRHESKLDSKIAASIKKEEEEDDNDHRDDGESTLEPTQRRPYTLLYACPSTSGRVTTHQLPQKTEVMRRARVLAEHLANEERNIDDKEDGESKSTTDGMQIVALHVI